MDIIKRGRKKKEETAELPEAPEPQEKINESDLLAIKVHYVKTLRDRISLDLDYNNKADELEFSAKIIKARLENLGLTESDLKECEQLAQPDL